MSYAFDDRTSFRGQAYAESNRSRSRSSFHTDQNHHPNRRPRSPLVPESFLPQSSTSQQSHFQQQQQSFAPKMRNGSNLTQPTSFEYNARIPRASPLSVSAAGRSVTPNKPIHDRQQLPGFGYSRSPHTPMTRFFVTVIPPHELASQADSSTSSRSTSFASSAHVKRGTLMPLYPTLGAQLYAISREYGLPSIGGLSIYLCDDGEGNLGPRVGEETWPYLWNRYFDDNAEDLYRDITNPSPSPSAMHIREASSFSNGHDRKYSAASGIDSRVDSNTERGTPVRGEDEEVLDDSIFHPLDPNINHRFQHTHLQNGPASYNGISPRQMMTPSPMRKGSSRGYNAAQDVSWRASPAASNMSSVSSKLPIVGRIEFAVDKSRAPWWNQFIGVSAAVHESRAAYEGAPGVSVPAVSARKHTQGRRSMHLPKQLNMPIDSRTASIEGPMTIDSRRSDDRKSYDTIASDAQTHSNASLFVPETSEGYAQLDDGGDQEEHVSYDERDEIQRSNPGDESLDVDEELGGVSQDGRSYAGFSALMDVVNGSSSNYEARSTRDMDIGALEADQIDEEEEELVNEDNGKHFNPHALDEMEDDRAWTGMQEQRNSRLMKDRKQENTATFDALSASTLSTMNKHISKDSKLESGQGRGSAVQDWIVKTHSPPTEQKGDEDHAQDADEESEASQDDIADVVGLWAAKASDPTGNIPLLPSIEERSFEPESATVTSTRRSSANYSVKSRPDSRPDSRSGSRIASRKDRESVLSTTSSTKRHSRHSSKSTSRASRHSRHSSRRNFGHASRASQDMQFIVDPRSDGELQTINPLLQAGTGIDLQGSTASLLSPIALQENDEGTFGGPSPNLSSLLPPQTPDAMRQGISEERDVQTPNEELRTRPYMLRQESLSAELPNVNSPTQLSPRQLDVPTPLRSPGQMSGSSSTSEMSDTLMDMERALALLSPAGFGQQRSPNLQILPTEETVEQEKSGKLSAPKRMRFSSHVSASESMARARSLSASVSASPRWFRSPQSDQIPAMPRIISPSEASVAYNEEKRSDRTYEQNNDKALKDEMSTLASRPKSLSAATQKAVENVSSEDVAELAALSVKHSSSSTNEGSIKDDAPQLPKEESIHELEKVVNPAVPAPEPFKEESITERNEDFETETEQVAVQSYQEKQISTEHQPLEKQTQELLEESYDSDSKDYAMRDEWIIEQRRHYSPTMPEKEEADESATDKTEETVAQQVQSSESKDEAAPTIVRPQYTTIGVQAEMPGSDRGSSQFSLVSGNETSSESYEAGTDEDDTHESVERQLSIDDVHAEQHSQEELIDTDQASQTRDRRSSETPRPLSHEKFESSSKEKKVLDDMHGKEEESGQSTDYQQSAFAHLIRGSFIESVSDAYSSKAVSPRIASAQEKDDDDEQLAWFNSRATEGMMEEHVNPFFNNHLLHREVEMNTDSPPQDDIATTRGGNSTNRNSILSGDQWSQDDSGSEGGLTSHAVNIDEDEENEIGHDDDHELMLPSRLSGISGISSHRDALEASGGRTPTFLYDQHLADIDQPTSEITGIGQFGPSLSPMSAEYPTSAPRSPLQSTDSLTVGPTSSKDTSTGQLQQQQHHQHQSLNDSNQNGPSTDALGIKFANPTPRLPAPTLQELIRRQEIISLAGEPVNDESERMPNGFEEVYVQSPTRSYASGTTRSANSDMIERPRYIETPLSSNELSGDTSSAPDQQNKDEKPIRRSMGSISDRRQDYRQNRRASLSAAGKASNSNVPINTGAAPAIKRNSPRLMVNDGSALPLRRSMSPLSPRYRFAALPPSPSLQGNAKLMQSINNEQLSHSTSVPGNVNNMSSGSPPEFAPPQPAFSARSSSFGNGSMSPNNNLTARNAFRQSNSAANSPRVRGSPLVIDTVKAQLGQWKRNKNTESNELISHNGPSSAPSYGIPVVPVYQANQNDNISNGTNAFIPPNEPLHFEQSLHQSTPAPFRGSSAGMKNNSTPPSPRGPRAQPFSIPSPINFTSSGIFSP